MSKIFRQQDTWAANSYARFLWLCFGLWEDILTLVDVYKTSNQKDVKSVIARHVIVDFDSLDDLINEFHGHVKNEELNKLKPEDQNKITDAFISYHRIVNPQKKLIKKIRNFIGAHRYGKPWLNVPQSGVTSPDEWGKWEQLLSSLDDECDLTKWKDTFNAAYQLLNILQDFNLDKWYSITDREQIKFYMPVLPPGYYPENETYNKE